MAASDIDLSFQWPAVAHTVTGTVLAALSGDGRQALARETVDLIVVGGGTAGIPAAIFAAERGARVVIIEKAPVLGGTLYLSGGLMAAAGTEFQQAEGIEDSADAHYDDIMRISNATSDPLLARLWADHGARAVNWLANNGFTIRDDHPVTTTGYDPYSVRRYQSGPEDGVSILKVIMPLLDRYVEEGRVTVLTQAAAVDLPQDDRGHVIGVVAEDSNGERLQISGANVLLASGGCAANDTMFQELHGLPLYRHAGYPFSQGDGLSLGVAAGGYLRGADNYVGYYGSVAMDEQIPSEPLVTMSIDPKVRIPWEVFVNVRGERFIREDHPSVNERDRSMDTQPKHRFWAIFDQQILDEAPPLIPDWSRQELLRAFDSHPMFARAGTLQELAVAAGIDPDGLAESLRDYNTAIENQIDDPLHRSHRPLPVAKPPFYAIRSQSWTLKSYAGLAVDENLQVVSKDGEPVGNLYAAGEVLGAATSGKSHTGGGSVTPAIAFARLLGENIIQF